MEKLKDEKQENLLLELSEMINQYKQLAFIKPKNAILYIPVKQLAECDRQELLDNGYIREEEDDNELLVTVTIEGEEYLNWLYGLNY